MSADSTSPSMGRVSGDSPPSDDYSMLLPFIYDTSSFSDRQVQLANTDTTTPEEGHEPAPSRPNAETSDDTTEKKGDEPAAK